MDRQKEIAKTIQEQLFAFGRVKVFSWGANSWTAIKDGLVFKVQGFKFKGTIKIVLVPNDTYTIQLIKDDKIEQEFTDVYFDQMTDLIDSHVEFTGKNYNDDVNDYLGGLKL